MDFGGLTPAVGLLESMTVNALQCEKHFPRFYCPVRAVHSADRWHGIYLGHCPKVSYNSLAIKVNCVKLTIVFLCAREARNIPHITKAK